MRRALYSDDWEAVSLRIRRRARGRCECTGECGLHRGRRCTERAGRKAKWAMGKVILTVHHTDFDKRNNNPKNLHADCQRCHLRADAPMRSERRKRLDYESGQEFLPGMVPQVFP